MGLKELIESLAEVAGAGESHGGFSPDGILARATIVTSGDKRAFDAIQARRLNAINVSQAVNQAADFYGQPHLEFSDRGRDKIEQLKQAERTLRTRIFYRNIVDDAREAGAPDALIAAAFELGKLRAGRRR